MPTIGISMIAHNEDRQIANALKSAEFADEIVVVNCESTDNTVAVVEQFKNVKLFNQPNNKNLNINKSYGFNQLKTDWIFYLDPDEIITPELQQEITEAINNKSFVAYKLPRKNIFFGKWLSHGSQYPDYQLRLFKKDCARFPNKHVHEMLQVDGKIGRLKSPFEHHPYPEVNDYIRKMNFYTGFQADFWLDSGMKYSFINMMKFMCFRPSSRFIRRYFFKLGFKNGWQGFLAAIGDAFQHIVSYAKFLEKMRDKK